MPGIIRSLLDIDYYKLTMAQVAFRLFRDVQVTYAFIDRSRAVSLPAFIDEEELRAEFDQVQALRFTPSDLDFLRESQYIPAALFSEEFLTFLGGLRLPDVDLVTGPSSFDIEVSGSWAEAMFWETVILSIVSELYGRSLLRRHDATVEGARAEGSRRLAAKIELIRSAPGVRFSDFGTRRRFSRDWHRQVIETLGRELPGQFLGTSNVLLARELGLRPIGTIAHEMDMVFGGIFHGSDDEIRTSHHKVLEAWWEQYGEDMSIALTDTYGTDFFLRDFTPVQARLWRGLRHDSGDPFEFGEKAIRFYERLGIDPGTKQLVFSDGLDVDTMLQLVDRFGGRTQVLFGWGTNLTNDVGFEPLPIVVKVVSAGGHGTVKLCDNLDKATGSPDDIARFMRIFGHEEVPRLGVRY